MMRVLFVVSENPVPARNGVTIPISNHLSLVRSTGVHVDVMLGKRLSTEALRQSCDHVWEVDLYKENSFIRAAKDALGFEPYFKMSISAVGLDQFWSEACPFDAVYYSPILMYNVADQIAKSQAARHGSRPRVVAAISDCYTATLRNKLISNGVGRRLSDYVAYLRSWSFKRVERQILSEADNILVQTNEDQKWIVDVVGLPESRVSVVTNGVEKRLFDIQNNWSRNVMVAADFRSELFRRNFVWFYRNVWRDPRITSRSPILHVFSRGYSDTSLSLLLNNDPSVKFHNAFVEDLAEVYRGKSICVAPIFKRYGFINKVAEAMAAGLVVVGDRGAFNGMTGIENRETAVIAESAEEFVSGLQELLDSEEISRSIAQRSRALATEQFNWGNRKSQLTSIFGVNSSSIVAHTRNVDVGVP
jgi:glycosyltransferase involved in cell wall biosynthesis